MLVKLGRTWFSADKVERIDSSIPPYECKLPNGKSSHYVSVRTFNCSDTTVIYVDTPEEAEKLSDEYADIVNEALAPKQSWSEEISEPEK